MLIGRSDVLAVVPSLGGNLSRLTATIDAVLASDFGGTLMVAVVWNDPRVPVPELPGAQVLTPGLNLGFPGALNHARSRAETDFVWVLQDDVRPEPDCLRALLARLDAADRPGVAAPVLVNADGLVPANSRAGFLRPDGSMEAWFPPEDCRPEDLDLSRSLDYVASSGSLVPEAVWDSVEGFDPDFYPLLWSDVDFCHRVRATGRDVALVPGAVIGHDRGGSTPGLLAAYLGPAQQERFRAKHVSGEAPLPGFDVEVDLIRRIGRSAGLALVDFGAYASREVRAERERTDRIQQSLWDEIAVRDRRIDDLERQVTSAASAEGPRRDREIAQLRRRLRQRRTRIRALREELRSIRRSRRWRLAWSIRQLSRHFR